MKALIVGYGRAGKRHGQLLDELGIDWEAYDPYTKDIPIGRKMMPGWILQDKPDEVWSFIVVCTPPKAHLNYLSTAIELDLPVLCEKPLCGWGQLEEAKKLPEDAQVMLAFNRRFHPDWVDFKRSYHSVFYSDWVCISEQQRTDLPEWGLTLDHLPHTFDLLYWLSGSKPYTRFFKKDVKGKEETTQVWGDLWDGRFSIWEKVTDKEISRVGGILTPWGLVRPDPELNRQMFLDMYAHFLSQLEKGEPFVPGIKEGLIVQECLEQVSAIR